MAVDTIKKAIKTAIQMEKDGYSFYIKAAAQTESEMGKAIFESLAADEKNHLDVFEKMFNETIGHSEWNELVSSSKKYEQIPIFPKDLKESEGDNPNISELDALRIAMDSEKKAIDFYKDIKNKINDSQILKIIDEIIDQEKNHYFILEGEFDHINSTGYWFDLDYLGN